MIQILIAAAAVLGAFVFGYVRGNEDGGNRVQVSWDKQKAVDRKAVDEANERADAQAREFGKWRAAQQPRIVYITRKVKDANAANPEWAAAPVPDGVRVALADAAAGIAGATGAARAVPAAAGASAPAGRDAAAAADDRRAPRSLGERLGSLGRLLGASGPAR